MVFKFNVLLILPVPCKTFLVECLFDGDYAYGLDYLANFLTGLIDFFCFCCFSYGEFDASLPYRTNISLKLIC